MKKFISTAVAALLAVSGLATCVGCKVKDNVVDDAKTINVRLYKAGYGEKFIYEFKDKFEAAYASEGYKFNVLTPQLTHAGTPMLNEMYEGYENKKIDLYITGAITPNMVSETGTHSKELCEDLEQLVFNQPAINYDLSETAETINQRVSSDIKPFMVADNGKTYGFAWVQSTAGLVVNYKKLTDFGITETPRTTNELFAMFDTILEKGAATKTYPVTYNLSRAQGGASTYQDCAFEIWYAQYDIQKYKEFSRMQTENADGSWTDMAEPWKVFQDENWRDVWEAGFKFMDEKYSPPGSGDTTMKLDQTQEFVTKAVGTNNAVFMLNGDWFLNEVSLSGVKEEQLQQLRFINTPVISALGVKLFGEGTKYELLDAECDTLLSYICKLVDEQKSIDEIVAAVKADKNIDLDAADAQAVATARGVTYARGIEHQAFIPKGCTKKEIAALALRMMASDDYANTFMSVSNGLSPYSMKISATSKYEFVNQAKAIATTPHFRAVNGRIQGLRLKVMKTDYLCPGEANLAYTLYAGGDANTFYQKNITAAQKLWNEYNG